MVIPRQPAPEALLKPREAARLLGVGPTTLARWARSGRISAQSTPGGQRRYRVEEIYAIIDVPPTNERETHVCPDDVVRLYDRGWSIRQVAEKFDCGYGYIRRLLLKQNVKLRTQSGRHRP